MKIAIVCPYSIDVPGGVQQQAIGLVDGIRTAGHQAWLVAPGTMGPPDVKLLGPAVRVRANGSVAPIALRPGTASKTRRAIAAADVVHIHEPLVFPTSSAALLGAGPPAVGTFHADPSPWMRRAYRVAAPVLRRTLSKLAAATAVSEVAAAAVRGLVDEISLIPNGIDVGAYSIEIERHPTRVVFLGRDEPRKGLDILLPPGRRFGLRSPMRNLLCWALIGPVRRRGSDTWARCWSRKSADNWRRPASFAAQTWGAKVSGSAWSRRWQPAAFCCCPTWRLFEGSPDRRHTILRWVIPSSWPSD